MAVVVGLAIPAAVRSDDADAPPVPPPDSIPACFAPLLATVPPVPEGPVFGVGRTPTPEEIERADIDVTPARTSMPAGSGRVRDGLALFAARCAACHGVSGEGGVG